MRVKKTKKIQKSSFIIDQTIFEFKHLINKYVFLNDKSISKKLTHPQQILAQLNVRNSETKMCKHDVKMYLFDENLHDMSNIYLSTRREWTSSFLLV